MHGFRVWIVAITITVCAASSAAASGWSGAAGLPGAKKTDATAATLADGSVLVAGGRSFVSLWEDAYRYFPATNEWQPAGAMADKRSLATSTTLPDGRVLVAGGDTMHNDPVVGSAELYDPGTNSWSPAASLNAARTRHTATLLADGRVLVAGGSGWVDNAVHALKSAEVYDPATNDWSPVAPMSVARINPTATRLADGRVLVTGGEGTPGTALKSTELYDPGTNRWSPGPDMDVPRRFHTATVLDDGTVLIVGGLDSEATLIFDPVTVAFTRGTPLPRPRERHTATRLLDGDVLIVDGTGNASATDTAVPSLRYRHASRTWVDAGNSGDATIGHVAALLEDGRVLVVGGSAANSIVSGRSSLWTPVTTVQAPAAVDFGAVTVPADRTVTVTNTGHGDLLVDDLRATGAAFTVTADSCTPAPVVPGAQCTVTVRFAPSALGSSDGTLTLSINSTPETVTVPLSGILVGPAPRTEPPVTPRTDPPPLKPVAKSVNVRVPVSGRVRGRSRCGGKATLTLLAGKSRVARVTVRTSSRCAYRKTFTLNRTRLGNHTRLTLRVRYAGRTTRSTVKVPVR